jgi:hypothetical protein
MNIVPDLKLKNFLALGKYDLRNKTIQRLSGRPIIMICAIGR